MGYREYKFPNAQLQVYKDRTCKMFFSWCAAIHRDTTRADAAAALRALRQHKATGKAPAGWR